MDIKNKIIFITGATSGIGLETAKKLLNGGAKVVIYSLATPKTPEIKTLGKSPSALIIKGDITKENQIKNAVKKTIKKFGRIDVLINNAAVAARSPFVDSNKKEWDFMIDINIKGTLTVTKEILGIMKKQKSGMIINISSGAGIYGIKNISIYSLTKAAIINFTQSLSQEVSGDNIKIITVTPGSTDTSMFKECFPKSAPRHTLEEVADVIVKTIKGEIKPDDKLIVNKFYHER